jgi:hypothetical protein
LDQGFQNQFLGLFKDRLHRHDEALHFQLDAEKGFASETLGTAQTRADPGGLQAVMSGTAGASYGFEHGALRG